MKKFQVFQLNLIIIIIIIQFSLIIILLLEGGTTESGSFECQGQPPEPEDQGQGSEGGLKDIEINKNGQSCPSGPRQTTGNLPVLKMGMQKYLHYLYFTMYVYLLKQARNEWGFHTTSQHKRHQVRSGTFQWSYLYKFKSLLTAFSVMEISCNKIFLNFFFLKTGSLCLALAILKFRDPPALPTPPPPPQCQQPSHLHNLPTFSPDPF